MLIFWVLFNDYFWIKKKSGGTWGGGELVFGSCDYGGNLID